MPSTRYSYNIDLDNVNTSHALAVLSVRPGARVLDIGAADGSVARVLTERGCRVWAVELDPDAARSALDTCEQVVIGDVEQLDLDAELVGTQFDYILLLDVLEHLRDPLTLLKRIGPLLDAQGEIIASIPNVAHGAVRLSLLQGAFSYTDTGLLDRTHLRFFDRRAIDDLFNAAGLMIHERLRVVRGLTETEIPVDLTTVPPNIVTAVESDPDATAYQFVIRAAPRNRVGATKTVGLAERLQHELDALERRFREVEGYAKSLEASHQEQVDRLAHLEALRTVEASRADELTLELNTRMDELQRHALELRHLRLDLAVKEGFVNELRAEIARRDETTADGSGGTADLRDELVRSQQTAVNLRHELANNQQELANSQQELANSQQVIVDLRDKLAGQQLVSANLARVREEFVSSPGVQWLMRTSAVLRKYPRLRALVHRMM